jgi:acetoin utilization protein AcuB
VLDAGELVGILGVADVLGTVAQYPVERPKAAAPDGGTAAAVMRADPLTCHEDDLLIAAAARMASAGVRHLCVVDGERRVTGMLSDRDVRRSFGEPRAALTRKPPARFGKLRVRQAWHAGARTVREDAPLTEVIDLLISTRVGAIPVVDREQRLRGIISYVDVLRQVAPEHAP